jgi:hypothetical protein
MVRVIGGNLSFKGYYNSWGDAKLLCVCACMCVCVRECVCAVGYAASAESSCKGGLIRGCSAELSAAQSRAHELAL